MRRQNVLDQRRYAMDRVNSIEETKIKEATAKHSVGGYEASPEEVLKALVAGKLPRAKAGRHCTVGVSQYTNVSEVFDIHGLDIAPKVNQLAIDADCKVIVHEATIVRDAIMLGDFETAQARLVSFSEQGKY